MRDIFVINLFDMGRRVAEFTKWKAGNVILRKLLSRERSDARLVPADQRGGLLETLFERENHALISQWPI